MATGLGERQKDLNKRTSPLGSNSSMPTLQKGQNLVDTAIQQNKDVLQGEDLFTKQQQALQQEQQQARASSAMGAQKQRSQLQGLGQVSQNIMNQMQQRNLESQQQQQTSALTGQLGARQQQAGSNLANLGTQQKQFDYTIGQDILEDQLAGADLTDAAQVEDFTAKYEQLYGVKPTVDNIISKQWNAKELKAQTDWDQYLLSNRANLYTDGVLDTSKIGKDKASRDALANMWDAEWEGEGGEFDINDPSHKEWMESKIKAGTTSEGTQIFNEKWNDIVSSGALEGYEPDVVDDIKASVKAKLNGQVFENDAGQLELPGIGVVGENYMKVGDTTVKLDKTNNTATIDNTDYTYDSNDGQWEDQLGVAIADPAKLDMLSKVKGQFVTKVDEVLAKKEPFNPQLASVTDAKELISNYKDGDTETVDNIMSYITDNTNIPTSFYNTLNNNEALKSSLKDNADNITFKISGSGSSRDKRKVFKGRPPKRGMITVKNGELVLITSGVSNFSRDAKGLFKGRDWGQKFTYKPLTGDNAGEELTMTTFG